MDFIVVKKPRVIPRRRLYRYAKRILDLFIVIVSMPVVVPVVLFSAFLVSMDSPGPAFFIQDRIGRGGRLFRLYKLRTMEYNIDDRQGREFMKAYVRGEVQDNDDEHQTFKPETAQHKTTRVGRFLRKTSIDELPQFLNVLKGEMSIVGPRPNVIWEVDEYKSWHHERLETLPGITGLAQVRGRSSIDFNSLVRYDIEYVEKQSMSLDFKILWWTVKTVVLGKGAE